MGEVGVGGLRVPVSEGAETQAQQIATTVRRAWDWATRGSGVTL